MRLRIRRVAAVAAGAAVLAGAGCDLGAPPVAHPAAGELVGAGDVDGDGELDLVTAGGDLGFDVLAGDGSGGFARTTVPHVTECTGGSTVRRCTSIHVTGVADVDGDGRDDVSVSYVVVSSVPGESTRTVHTLRLAEPSGGFGAPVALPGPGQFADVTGDGHVDLVSVDEVGSDPQPLHLRVRPGDGTGAFGSEVASPLPGDHPFAEPVVADVTGDGVPDLVLGGSCVQGSGEALVRGCVDVLAGDGSGAFPGAGAGVPAVRLPQPTDPAVDGVSVALGDLSGDGVLDLVEAGRGSTFDGGGAVRHLAVRLGTGGPEVFGPARPVRLGAQAIGTQLADFDADGHLDVLVRTSDDDLDQADDWGRILFGTGSGGLDGSHVVPAGDLVIADLSGDGRPDLARSVPAPDRVLVYLNRWEGRPVG